MIIICRTVVQAHLVSISCFPEFFYPFTSLVDADAPPEAEARHRVVFFLLFTFPSLRFLRLDIAGFRDCLVVSGS